MQASKKAKALALLQSVAETVLERARTMATVHDPIPSGAWFGEFDPQDETLDFAAVHGSAQGLSWNFAPAKIQGAFLRTAYSNHQPDFVVHVHEMERQAVRFIIVLTEGHGHLGHWVMRIKEDRTCEEPVSESGEADDLVNIGGDLVNITGTLFDRDDSESAKFVRERALAQFGSTPAEA